MVVKQAELSHLDEIMRVLKIAQQFMVQSGNPNQWEVGYPSKEMILADIKAKNGYILIEGEEVCGYFAFIIGVDPTYGYIEGEWLSDAIYGTIHRIASDQSRKGLFKQAIAYCLTKCNHLRIDTHADNAVMQKLISREGFSYCGIIYIDDGTPRLAYECI